MPAYPAAARFIRLTHPLPWAV